MLFGSYLAMVTIERFKNGRGSLFQEQYEGIAIVWG